MMDFQPLWDSFRELNATTGIKLTIFYDAFDRARFFNGFLTSVRLMSLCIVCSVAIGILGAWAQGSRLRLVRAVTAGYIFATRRRWCSSTSSISRWGHTCG
jgi:polar amino acid transport system permease protein